MAEARIKVGLPLNGKFILFGSFKITDKRKGVDYLVGACNILLEKHPELCKSLGIVVFGKDSDAPKELISLPGYAQDYVTKEHDLVAIYNAVD